MTRFTEACSVSLRGLSVHSPKHLIPNFDYKQVNMYSYSLLPTKPFVVINYVNNLSVRKLNSITAARAERTSKDSSVSSRKIIINPLLESQIQQVIERQSEGITHRKQTKFDPVVLREAYERCQKLCANDSTTYYLASLLLTKERKRAIWAIYAWGRRIDELVDGPNAKHSISSALDSWEERLVDIFEGRPHDIVDTALADTVQRFPLDIQPFRDVIKGMKMDTWKSRYENFEELELYCFYVAATFGLMTVPILGISQDSAQSIETIYKMAVCFGIGNQLTNILRDVEEDASMGRIYLPRDELAEFGLSEKDILSRNVTDEWREFMKKQIARARSYFTIAEEGTAQLHSASRWPVWASSMLYQRILDKIEHNNYDNLTKRARVGTAKKLLTLPLAYAKAMGYY